MYGYHKHQSQSNSIHHYNNPSSHTAGDNSHHLMGRSGQGVGPDGFDKTRKISVLYWVAFSLFETRLLINCEWILTYHSI